MVTVITDKLKYQSLEDLPGDETEKNAVQLRLNSGEASHISECPLAHRLRRDVRQIFGHSRTQSYPSHRLRRTYCKNCCGAESLAMHSTPAPPANKKLCSTLSLPDNESVEAQLLWVPRASSVWHPVENYTRKPQSASFADKKLMEPVLGINNEINSISTPPASPTPRPASAYAAFDEKLFVENSENKDYGHLADKARDLNFNWKPNALALHRSRSQPCFDRKRSGMKRRLDEELDARRPALDLAKMEETSYYRCRDRKKGLRIPKYMNKRATKGLTSYFTEPEKFTLKPIASSPMDAQGSSIMITPNSSPTKQMDSGTETVKNIRNSSAKCDLKNSAFDNLSPKVKDEGNFRLDYDSDLDINSIEEDDLF
ncbi:protein FAM53A-like [Montipora capricornis]|uniref:protein FAM53A-like n=1 Tax=Montipora foliosa TaxID=591990 RepID=UPI0035F20D80